MAVWVKSIQMELLSVVSKEMHHELFPYVLLYLYVRLLAIVPQDMTQTYKSPEISDNVTTAPSWGSGIANTNHFLQLEEKSIKIHVCSYKAHLSILFSLSICEVEMTTGVCWNELL